MADTGTILLAEDDLVLQEMYQERLSAEGYKVELAKDGDEALKKIQSLKPNLILLDIMMPKMNGIDVLKQIKADAATKDIPVIVSTALVQDMNELKAMLDKRDAYLIKSEVTPKEVIALVKQKLNPAAWAYCPV